MLLETQQLTHYAEIFVNHAESYHRAMEAYPQAREKEFLNVLQYAELLDGQTILDVPSAGGYLTPHTPLHAKLVGLDPSGFFASLKRTTEQKVVRCEEQEFPYRDCSADRIVSISGAHLMTDRIAFFREIKRVLKLGGILSIADIHSESKVASFLRQFVDKNSSRGYIGKFVDDNTQRFIESAGMVVTFAQRISFPWKFPSIEAAVEFFTLLFAIDQASPQQVEEAIRNHLGIQKIGKEYFVRWELMFYKATRLRL